ncbi:MAG: hypothetical protein J7J91_06865 [Deltaproteobacteria bacterium]|nr:hypothetical protein [Deltaproteobacteria bacterium]
MKLSIITTEMGAMVDATTCRWSKEGVKALIAFLIAEKKRHEHDIQRIERSIERLRREYDLTKEEMDECERFAWLFIEF